MGLNIDSRCFMTGKSRYRYVTELDYAISSVGVIRKQRKYRYVVMGEGHKVFFQNRGWLEPERITLAGDRVAEVGDDTTHATLRDLLKRAIHHKSRLTGG